MKCFTPAHCPKNNLNLRIKTEPVSVGADSTVYVCLLCTYTEVYLAQKPDIYRCISFNCDRLSVFYAEIQVDFGTVYAEPILAPAPAFGCHATEVLI